jgi:hypothetical protein|nr:MAG TPA: Helix-turn-helix XRE-family like protein [Caudoviricetes sp.]
MNKIKERREALGLSQAALGEKIGCSQQHIQRLENGGEITPDKILSLSTVLNIPVTDLIPNNLRKIISALSECNCAPKSSDDISLSENKFIEIISTAFDVFYEYMSKNPREIKNIGQKMAAICLSATKVDTTDRKGQMQAMVVNLYTKKAG